MLEDCILFYNFLLNGARRMLAKYNLATITTKEITIKCAVLLFTMFLLSYCVHPGRFASHYSYIMPDDIIYELEPSPDVTERQINGNKKLCSIMPQDLDDSMQNINTSVSSEDLLLMSKQWNLQEGGAWEPQECISQHQVAIIIPFRDRSLHLQIFLAYMHPFLQKQLLNYRIVVIEQMPKLPFNRAKLFNIGFAEASKIFPFHCFIFHDVDLIPQKLTNMYACTHQPRHMSSSVNTFRYNLPYSDLFGGAVAVLGEQFKNVNGFSNVFFGWGGEDDDFYNRIQEKDYKICRFAPNVARYFMLSHAKELPSENRFVNLKSGKERFETDGLTDLQYTVKKIEFLPLYTWIVVDV